MFQAIGELMIEHEGATLEGLKQHVGHAPMLRQRDGSTGVVRGRARGRAGCSHDPKARGVKQHSKEHLKAAMAVIGRVVEDV